MTSTLELAPKKRKITKQQILDLTNDLIDEYIREKNWRTPEDIRLDIQDMYETVIYPRIEYTLVTSLNLGHLENNKILGKTVPQERVILLDNSISPPNYDPRYPFTFGHEIGHAFCHTDEPESFRCSQDEISSTDSLSPKEADANFFSANFLMPEFLVKLNFHRCYNPKRPFAYYGKGQEYCFTAYGSTRIIRIDSYSHFCVTLAKPLTTFFSNVSKTSLGLRIHNLGLVLNYSKERILEDVSNIGSILKNIS